MTAQLITAADSNMSDSRDHSSVPSVFSRNSTIYMLCATGGKKTEDCCTSKLWGYRDRTIDHRIPADQPKIGACTIMVLEPIKEWNLVEAAAALMKVSPHTPVEMLHERLLNEHSNVLVSLAQVQGLVEATERGDKTGLADKGYSSFAFAKNRKGKVSIIEVLRRGGARPWYARLARFSSTYEWSTFCRFMVADLNPPK